MEYLGCGSEDNVPIDLIFRSFNTEELPIEQNRETLRDASISGPSCGSSIEGGKTEIHACRDH